MASLAAWKPQAVACSPWVWKLLLTGLALDGARVAVQGFGNVGGIAPVAEAGAKVVAVQDHTGTIFNSKGLMCPRCWRM